MGNKAMLISENNHVGIYLHWNGGLDSVGAFLKYCELRGFRGFDHDYGKARFCQVVGNFFGGGMSMGIEYFENIRDLEDWWLDNGVYIISGWEIKKRLYTPHENELEWEYNLEFLKYIDERQPESEQLGDYLESEDVDASELEIGDVIFIPTIDCGFRQAAIAGISEEGIPYHDSYAHGYDNQNNRIVGICKRKKKEKNDECI